MNMSMVAKLPRIRNADDPADYSNHHFDSGMIRHMILNSLRDIIRRHKVAYGTDIIIAIDDKKYWRRDVFPNYKANRKKDREASPWNWDKIFEYMALVKQELIDNFPYKVMQIEGCEADDIIGTIVHKKGTIGQFGDIVVGEKILIISGDKDFSQLQIYDNVDQYSPQAGKKIVEKQPITHLKRHIIKGDSGDGIPNILSPDDTFVSGGRQKKIMDTYLKEWLHYQPEQFCNGDMMRNWKRNELLIDLSKIPSDVQKQVLDTYDAYKVNPRSKMFNYFIKYKLKELHAAINDF